MSALKYTRIQVRLDADPFPTRVTWLCFHLVAAAAKKLSTGVTSALGAELAEVSTERSNAQALLPNYRHYQFVAAGKHLQFHMVLMWRPEALRQPQTIKNMLLTTLVSVSFWGSVPPQTLCHLRSLCSSLHIPLCVMGPWHQAGVAANPEARRSAECHAVETRCA